MIAFFVFSNAILQYLADRYPKDEVLYPKNVQTRAIVNHRLAFNLSTYYRSIGEYVASNLHVKLQKIYLFISILELSCSI